MRGKIKRRVVVYSNDMEHNAVALSVEAHIQPELRVDPNRFELELPAEGGERYLELEVENLSDRVIEQLSVRTTVEGLKPTGEIPAKLAPQERFALRWKLEHPACGPETECVESGYIIVEGHGHGRNREKIPVLIRNVPLAR
jgi:hypothetical protein